MIIIPATPGFDLLCIDTNDEGYSATPIIAWAIDDDNIADDPQPITVTGIPARSSDGAIRYPDQTIHYDGEHYSEPERWVFAVRATKRSR